MIGKGLQIEEGDDDVVKMFDDYRSSLPPQYQDNPFSFIMKDLVGCWVSRVKEKRCRCDLRRYLKKIIAWVALEADFSD